MFEGMTWHIAMVSLVAWILSILILLRYIPLTTSVIVGTIKIGIVFIYFSWFYDGTWHIKDDLKYDRKAQTLLELNSNPLNLLLTTEGRETLLFATDRSRHVLYTWWVYSTQYLMGSAYYVPVFFNVVLTCVVGILLYRLCVFEGFSEQYAKGLLVMFLLHWDVLAWSSLISIKDTLVMSLTIGLIALAWPVFKHPNVSIRSTLAVLAIALIIFALTFIRFYIPVVLGAAVLIYFVLKIDGSAKYYLLTGGAALISALILTNPLIQFHIEKDIVFNLESVLLGIVRFPVTPKPWPLEPAYTFLFIPAALHWLFFIPMLIGGYMLWRESDLMKLLILFFLMAVVFYAIVELLQNPRQRYQFSYIIVWMQFHVFVLLFNRVKPKRNIRIAA